MNELWSKFQCVLIEREKLASQMWHLYNQADEQTRLLMSNHLIGVEWKERKEVHRVRERLMASVRELASRGGEA